VTGPPATRRQRPRRRRTPNTNTSTTTMISTHNHVDMAASLVAAGAVQADATATYPSKQLGHRQATSRPGSTAALRGVAGTPAPRDLPRVGAWTGHEPVDPPRSDVAASGRACCWLHEPLVVGGSQPSPSERERHQAKGN
jgi:hypothetical protein